VARTVLRGGRGGNPASSPLPSSPFALRSSPLPHELKINRLDFWLFSLKLKGTSGAQSQHTQ
jgi:hypothetical protein